MSHSPPHENDLHAYVDGRLPVERRPAVEAWLAAHPEAAERAEAYRRQNLDMRALFQPILAEDLPEGLRQKAEACASAANQALHPGHGSGFWQRIAAGVLIAVCGAAGGWFGHAQYQANAELTSMARLPHRAAIAHVVFSPDARRPVEVGAEQEAQLVKWLSKRLATPVSPPRLGALGYELVGGRLLPGERGPVAQFMYQDSAGQRMTLYLTPENRKAYEPGFRFAREGEVNVFYWVDGRFGYALSAAFDKGELARIAAAVYEQLGK